MSSTLTIRIPDNLKKELDKICRSNRLKTSELVREALLRVISLHQFDRMRKGIAPFAEKAGVFGDEDVFKLIS